MTTHRTNRPSAKQSKIDHKQLAAVEMPAKRLPLSGDDIVESICLHVLQTTLELTVYVHSLPVGVQCHTA